MEPLVSIIVPIYKVEKYLEKCIKSIINQSYRKLEIILVDDGSPDKCGQICDEFARNDNRIHVIHKKNGGLSDARNSGIEVANGEYLGFVDSDDWIEKDMYKNLIEVALNKKADIVECSFISTSNRDYINEEKNNMEIYTFSNTEALENHLYGKNLTRCIWNKIYKRELFKDIRFPEKKLAEDLYTSYKLFYNSNLIAYTDYKGYYYYLRENSIMGQASPQLIISIYEGTKEQHEFICKNAPELKKRIDKLYMNCLLKTYSYICKNKKLDQYKFIVSKEINRSDIEISGITKVLRSLYNVSPQLSANIISIINNRKR